MFIIAIFSLEFLRYKQGSLSDVSANTTQHQQKASLIYPEKLI